MSLFNAIGSAADSALTSMPVVGGIFSGLDEYSEEQQVKKDIANRPKYSPPDVYNEIIQNARAQTTAQMPGYTEAQQNIDRQMAYGGTKIKDLSSGSGNTLAASEKMRKQQSDMYQGLLTANSKYHTNRYDKLTEVLNTMGQQQQQAWDYNVNQPWQQTMNWDINKYQGSQQTAANTEKNTYALAGTILTGGMSGFTGGGNLATDASTISGK